jgi:hypothetical protein
VCAHECNAQRKCGSQVTRHSIPPPTESEVARAVRTTQAHVDPSGGSPPDGAAAAGAGAPGGVSPSGPPSWLPSPFPSPPQQEQPEQQRHPPRSSTRKAGSVGPLLDAFAADERERIQRLSLARRETVSREFTQPVYRRPHANARGFFDEHGGIGGEDGPWRHGGDWAPRAYSPSRTSVQQRSRADFTAVSWLGCKWCESGIASSSVSRSRRAYGDSARPRGTMLAAIQHAAGGVASLPCGSRGRLGPRL